MGGSPASASGARARRRAVRGGGTRRRRYPRTAARHGGPPSRRTPARTRGTERRLGRTGSADASSSASTASCDETATVATKDTDPVAREDQALAERAGFLSLRGSTRAGRRARSSSAPPRTRPSAGPVRPEFLRDVHLPPPTSVPRDRRRGPEPQLSRAGVEAQSPDGRHPPARRSSPAAPRAARRPHRGGARTDHHPQGGHFSTAGTGSRFGRC